LQTKIQKSVSEKVFDVLNILFLFLFALITLVPFLYIIAGSFSSETELINRSFFLIPEKIQIDGYKHIFSTGTVARSLLVSILITIVGTIINLFVTMTMAYALSKKYLIGRSIIMKGILFSMLFPPTLIPAFIVVKTLGLYNTYWALWLSVATNGFAIIVVRTFFQQLPEEIEESARIEGCNAFTILWKIVLPLSAPVIATFTLFFAVTHWNSYFQALVFIRDAYKMPLQVILRQIVLLSGGLISDMSEKFITVPAQSVKMGVIVIATVPILCVYPFLQKHFVKGMLIGSIK
jgi:putative aldouronate transport system permease protein